MAIQTIQTFYLGIVSDLDTNDSNFQSENAAALVGQTFGSAGTPLYDNIGSLILDDQNNDGAVRTNDAGQTGELIEFGGVSEVFDSVQTYNVTLTYIDGSTAPAHLVVVQDVTGRTFVTSWNIGNADNAPLSAAPIESIRIDSVNIDTAAGLRNDLDEDVFVDATVQGTTGDDSISGSYTDADGTQLNAYGGDDTVFGGDGNDTILGGAGDDVIDGGNDADVLSGGGGQDTITGGDGDDTIDGGDRSDVVYGGSGNDSISDSGGSASDDTIFGEAGDDTIAGGAREDFLDGGDDADTFILEDGFGNDTIIGGEGGTDSDTIDLSALTGQVTVLFTGNEQGTISSGGSFANFSQIEQFILPNGETVASGSGGDILQIGDAGGNGIGTGPGDDTISGGGGSDSIGGGGGDDLIFGDDGNDGIGGGDGNDQIFGGEGDDGIGGDGGNDTIDGGGGSDGIGGGDGDDVIFGGDGNDGIGGDAGNDTVDGGDGNDSIGGGTGNDVVLGGSGNDNIGGDSGDDTVDGGSGDDEVAGGTGNDLLTGGSGNDTFGYNVGDGSDTITDFNAGNSGTLDDGDNTNNDSIDLSGFYDSIFELHEDQADDGILNQSNTTGPDAVDYSDNDQFGPGAGITFTGASADSSSFTSENTGVVCFTSGTAIRTPQGEALIDDLKVGDWVTTMDNGPQRIVWIGQRHVTQSELLQNEKLYPVLIKEGAMGATGNLLVSRQHGMLLGGDTFGRAAHLVKAAPNIRIALGKRQVTYIHLMFEAHQIIFAQGVPSESFYPGPIALEMLAQKTREELMTLFPSLNAAMLGGDVASIYGPTARAFLENKKAVRLWLREANEYAVKRSEAWSKSAGVGRFATPSGVSMHRY